MAEDRMMRHENEVSEAVVLAAIAVHRALGPGLLESAYEGCLAHEFVGSGLVVERQKLLPIRSRGALIDNGYRVDLLVEDLVVVELKAIEKILPIHQAQLLTYLRFAGCRVGLLLNFNAALMKDGIQRMVYDPPPERADPSGYSSNSEGSS